VDYLCELEAGTVQAASDVAKAGWFTLDETKRLKMAPGTAGVLDSALALLAQRALAQRKRD
jgi:predicted NUDIX family NTP pyrophosphohydrolase